MDSLVSVAILSGEVPSRLDYVKKSIDSINSQTYSNIQKILVNGGNPPHQTEQLIERGIDLEGWTIIDFPIDTMEAEKTPSHKYTGAAALLASKGEFFFTMNDDDFLEPNYFSKIMKLFEKYPTAISGMGIKVRYYHETGTFGKVQEYHDKNGQKRLEFESGRSFIQKTFFDNHVGYHPALGCQPIVKTSFARDVSSTLFYDGGFPDYSSYFQIVARGDCVFENTAKMFWGIHSNASSLKATARHFYFMQYKYDFKKFSEVNCLVYKSYFPSDRATLKKIRLYFLQSLTFQSLLCVRAYFISLVSLFGESKQKHLVGMFPINMPSRFPLLSHLFIIFKNPILSAKAIIKKI